MPQQPDSLSHDVIVNQFALQDADTRKHAQSILQRFLGSSAKDHDASQNDLPEPQDDLEFEPSGNLQGLGYVKPHDEVPDSGSRERSAATERLREQMLGKRRRPKFKLSAANAPKAGGTMQASKPRPKKARIEAESDDEEVGRSQLTKKAKNAWDRRFASHEETGADTPCRPAIVPASSHDARKGTSYLDQVLAERAAKGRKGKSRQTSKMLQVVSFISLSRYK